MSKKLKISFNASGTQVDADLFNNDVWEEVKRMGKSGEYDVLDLISHIEDNRHEDGVIVANGVCIDSDGLECTIEDEDGNKIEFDILMIDSDDDEMTFDDWVENQGLEDSKYILVHRTENTSMRDKEEEPTKDQHFLIKTVDYDYGQLHGDFKVEDDFDLKNIDMNDFVLKTIDLDGESELDGRAVGNGEIDIVGITYKGKDVELGLDFQGGGGGENLVFIRDENGRLSEIDLEDLIEEEDDEEE